MQSSAQERERAGPPADPERLFREHHRGVFRAALRITGSAADAEDVLQTVFLRLLRRSRIPDLSYGARSYFHRAAVNAAVDLLRSRGRSSTVPLEEVDSRLAQTPHAAPEARQYQHDLRQALRRALGRLRPRAAEVFALRYFEGYSNSEIARLLGTSSATVAVVLHRSRKRLKKDLRSFEGGAS